MACAKEVSLCGFFIALLFSFSFFLSSNQLQQGFHVDDELMRNKRGKLFSSLSLSPFMFSSKLKRKLEQTRRKHFLRVRKEWLFEIQDNIQISEKKKKSKPDEKSENEKIIFTDIQKPWTVIIEITAFWLSKRTFTFTFTESADSSRPPQVTEISFSVKHVNTNPERDLWQVSSKFRIVLKALLIPESDFMALSFGGKQFALSIRGFRWSFNDTRLRAYLLIWLLNDFFKKIKLS